MTNKHSYQLFLKDQITIPSLLLRKYQELGLNEQEVMLILQIHCFYLEGNSFPTPYELASYSTLTEQECSTILRKLIQKNMLSIDQNQNDRNVLNEQYSLEQLWKILYTPKPEQKPIDNEQTNIFILFEQEFGRPLSPFEIETVNIWIDEDEQPPALIKAALREAVLMGKLNFRYIDRILREWKKKGIHSVEQARNHSKSFHTKQGSTEKTNETKRDVSLYYNWLDE
ncbi:DnaD domain-containing protein [Aquibacillus kalidii]|uniref:DnaD domain-containing protein n=1 Tax=Aquibacillus kalidii TaxID=2762597 RepID=UPI001F375ADD|nr:DnaD domain-containing protein [Aquibacillus kalidii]